MFVLNLRNGWARDTTPLNITGIPEGYFGCKPYHNNNTKTIQHVMVGMEGGWRWAMVQTGVEWVTA